MELQTFVSESLKQIVDGILDAQNHAAEKSATINPENLYRSNSGDLMVARTLKEPWVQEVRIDVALTATSSHSAGGKIELQVASIGLGPGVKGEQASGHESISRISFSIPVILPTQ